MDIDRMVKLAGRIAVFIRILKIACVVLLALCAVSVAWNAAALLDEGIGYGGFQIGGFWLIEPMNYIDPIDIGLSVGRAAEFGIYVVFGLIVLFELDPIVATMREGRPFDASMGRSIRRLAFTLLSIWLVVVVGFYFLDYSLFQFAGGYDGYAPGGGLSGQATSFVNPPDFDLDPALFGAFLILLLLSHAFTYGIELQRLSDETV